jgi:hypothetical protein
MADGPPLESLAVDQPRRWCAIVTTSARNPSAMLDLRSGAAAAIRSASSIIIAKRQRRYMIARKGVH